MAEVGSRTLLLPLLPPLRLGPYLLPLLRCYLLHHPGVLP
jgi:hypothetical protein